MTGCIPKPNDVHALPATTRLAQQFSESARLRCQCQRGARNGAAEFVVVGRVGQALGPSEAGQRRSAWYVATLLQFAAEVTHADDHPDQP